MRVGRGLGVELESTLGVELESTLGLGSDSGTALAGVVALGGPMGDSCSGRPASSSHVNPASVATRATAAIPQRCQVPKEWFDVTGTLSKAPDSAARPSPRTALAVPTSIGICRLAISAAGIASAACIGFPQREQKRRPLSKTVPQ